MSFNIRIKIISIIIYKNMLIFRYSIINILKIDYFINNLSLIIFLKKLSLIIILKTFFVYIFYFFNFTFKNYLKS